MQVWCRSVGTHARVFDERASAFPKTKTSFHRLWIDCVEQDGLAAQQVFTSLSTFLEASAKWKTALVCGDSGRSDLALFLAAVVIDHSARAGSSCYGGNGGWGKRGDNAAVEADHGFSLGNRRDVRREVGDYCGGSCCCSVVCGNFRFRLRRWGSVENEAETTRLTEKSL